MALPVRQADKPIRVLVVDDSIFMRRAVERMINAMPGATVIGTANDGAEAIARAVELRPDVITMDVEMARMDGVHAVAEIMRVAPTPVVMLSTLTQFGAETTIRALEAGAVDCVAKPSGLSFELGSVADRLAQAISRSRYARPLPRSLAAAAAPVRSTGRTVAGRAASRVVVIAASTGGPPALSTIIPMLPGDLNAAVLVVQHMPAGFTSALARRLNSLSALSVTEAAGGEALTCGAVFVAAGDRHLRVSPQHRTVLDEAPPLHGVRPAADITLESVVRVFGARTTAVVLTGMGKDAAAGAAMVERSGGRVFVQDEATSVVYGMPHVTRELVQSAVELPIEQLAAAIESAVAA